MNLIRSTPTAFSFLMVPGSLTVLIRLANISCYEAMVFAILLASLFSPLIDHVVVRLNIRRRRMRLQEASGDAG